MDYLRTHYSIVDKSSFYKWCLTGHPDKGGDGATFTKVHALYEKYIVNKSTEPYSDDTLYKKINSYNPPNNPPTYSNAWEDYFNAQYKDCACGDRYFSGGIFAEPYHEQTRHHQQYVHRNDPSFPCECGGTYKEFDRKHHMNSSFHKHEHEEVMCECGHKIMRKNMKKHLATLVHITRMTKIHNAREAKIKKENKEREAQMKKDAEDKEPVTCECGKIIKRKDMEKHIATKGHVSWVKKNQTEDIPEPVHTQDVPIISEPITFTTQHIVVDKVIYI